MLQSDEGVSGDCGSRPPSLVDIGCADHRGHDHRRSAPSSMGSSRSTCSVNASPSGPGVLNQPEAEPTWLLLHGTPLTPRVWDEVGALLVMSRPVVAPALPRPGTQTEIARRVLASLEDAAGTAARGRTFLRRTGGH